MGKIIAILLVAVVLVLGAGGAGAYFYGMNVYERPGPKTADGKPRVVMIAKGATVQQTADALKKAGAIPDAFQLRMAMRVLDTAHQFDPKSKKLTLKTGEYAVPSGASLKDVIALLDSSKTLHYTVVVPEGRTSQMIVDLLTAGDWPQWRLPGSPRQADDLTMKLAGPAPATPPEGVLMPGDYMVERGDSIADVLGRMQKAQQALLNDLWPKRKEGLPFGTPGDAVILASIVENETHVPAERPLVASLFVNRLIKKIRLQSDVTTVYGISRGVPLGHGLRVSELQGKTDWNTYQMDGLPKTPICNPSKEALAAVLNPPETGYLFFVADGTGGHAFAATVAEHNANVAKWRKIETAANAAAKPTTAPATTATPTKAPAPAPKPPAAPAPAPDH